MDEHTGESGNSQRLFSWKAPLRAYKKRSKNILGFYLALSLLISLIVFFFGDRILLIPILTLLFLFYVLTITPPLRLNTLLPHLASRQPELPFVGNFFLIFITRKSSALIWSLLSATLPISIMRI